MSILIYEELSSKVIGCALEVHKELGPGLLENVYEDALCFELEQNGILYERQKKLEVNYKGKVISEYKLDLVVENKIVIELKSVKELNDIHSAQILTYMKIGHYKVGLLINFNSLLLKNGVKRFVL